MNYLASKTNFKIYGVTGNIDLEPNINCITFLNNGLNPLTINNTWPLVAGAALIIKGNPGEVDDTKYSVQFTQGAGTLIVATKVLP